MEKIQRIQIQQELQGKSRKLDVEESKLRSLEGELKTIQAQEEKGHK